MTLQLPKWLKQLTNHVADGDDDDDVTLLLQAPIGGADGITGEAFSSVLDSIEKKRGVSIHIDTLGGSMQEGTRIANAIRLRGGVTTRVVGYAASMGAVIHQAGAKREMMPGTMLIIHNPQAQTQGDVAEHERAINVLKSAKTGLVDMFSERSGQPKGRISRMMDEITAIGPQDALALGLNDEVVTGAPISNEMRFVDVVKALGFNLSQQPIVPVGEAGGNGPKEKDAMSKLIGALAKFKLVNSADLNDEQATTQAEANIAAVVGERDSLKTNVGSLMNQVTTLSTERDSLKTEVEAHRNALKTRVTNRVAKAIEDKKIKPERKDALIAAGLENEVALDFLDDIQVAGSGSGRRAGAAPLPASTTGGADTLESLRNSMLSSDATPEQVAEMARKARELRGHKGLAFEGPAERVVNHKE